VSLARWSEISNTLGLLHSDFATFSRLVAIHKAAAGDDVLFRIGWAWLAAEHSHQQHAEEL
jgi:hypothetical protein